MSARKSSHRTIFLIVSSGSPLALIASSLRSTSKKPVCPMTRSFHPPMAHCNQRVRFAATWREEFSRCPYGKGPGGVQKGAEKRPRHLDRDCTLARIVSHCLLAPYRDSDQRSPTNNG